MIVNYSSSSSEEETEHSSKNDSSPLRKRRKPDAQTSTSEPLDHGSVKRKAGNLTPRLPLPDSVKEMFRESEEQWTDKSEEHGGRHRSFQHERGNWATYVFCPYDPEEAFLELLNEIMAVAAAHGVPMTLSEEFHLSLSKTVVLRHHWIQPFIQSIRTGLTQFHKTFLGMEISTGQTQLLELIKIVDETMKEFNLSTFYKDPSFHISLAWCVGNHTEKLKKTCLSEMQSLVDAYEDGPFYIKLNCTELRCKAGNKVFLFPLQ
ncbi:U6 snRNA phosphodiesterase [Labeo rohita]|uniref:U6 snRNA phosphodiesterase n=1 Tax=Labeo rohita TaxID=84645 RepID=A0ABQ8LCL6_LABRO|nr:U6 snRNA phosphodiesterase [Labeo rohita]